MFCFRFSGKPSRFQSTRTLCLAFLFLPGVALVRGCGPAGAAKPGVAQSPPASSVTPPLPAAAAPTPDLFASSVRPVLSVRCAPCHEPGGKMYGRLPFDDAKVVSSHSQGILRRLKGDDRRAVERWLASLGSPAPAKEAGS